MESQSRHNWMNLCFEDLFCHNFFISYRHYIVGGKSWIIRDNGNRESGELVHFILYLNFSRYPLGRDMKCEWSAHDFNISKFTYIHFLQQFQGLLIEKISFFY